MGAPGVGVWLRKVGPCQESKLALHHSAARASAYVQVMLHSAEGSFLGVHKATPSLGWFIQVEG